MYPRKKKRKNRKNMDGYVKRERRKLDKVKVKIVMNWVKGRVNCYRLVQFVVLLRC